MLNKLAKKIKGRSNAAYPVFLLKNSWQKNFFMIKYIKVGKEFR